jgi:hypothetical protein
MKRRSTVHPATALSLVAFALSTVALTMTIANAKTETPTTEPEPVAEPVCIEVVEETPAPVEVETEPLYTDLELEQLAITIYNEAGADFCSDSTRMMVGTVVMNRVADPRYPNTIEEVLLQKSQYSDFSWNGIRWPERAGKDVEAHAVARAYDCALRILEGERALPADVIYQAEFEQGTEVVAHQDGMYFCR